MKEEDVEYSELVLWDVHIGKEVGHEKPNNSRKKK